MKLTRIAGLLLISIMPTLYAQKATKIESIIKVSHDSLWYAQQAELWKAETKKRPDNENAWKNYLKAKRYESHFGKNSFEKFNQEKKEILQQMKKAIPDSYTYYLSLYDEERTTPEAFAAIEKAIRLQPDNVEEFPAYMGYALLNMKPDLIKEYSRKWYDSGNYSQALLSYSYNQLIGMEKKGIIFDNGDAGIFSKAILQYGKYIFTDKKICYIGFLSNPEYMDYFCQEIGIRAPEWTPEELWEGCKEHYDVNNKLAGWIIDKTDRAIYFSPVIDNDFINPYKENLYSEGLVMRYSKKPYDNMSVMKDNYEQKYLTDYLKITLIPDRNWEESAKFFNLNYVTSFRTLLSYYHKTGDTDNYKKLYSLLENIILQAPDLEEQRKKEYKKLLNVEL